MKNVGQYGTLDPIECLELNLKAIVLNTYEGKTPDVDFAKFFVLNAKVLHEIKFGVSEKFEQKGETQKGHHDKLHALQQTPAAQIYNFIQPN